MPATSTYTNPVHRAYFADPFIWRAGEVWCAIGTGAADAAGAPSSSVFPLLRSHDFVNWQPAGHALARPEASLGSACWAPEVAATPDGWFLYYSVGHGDRLHQLRVAHAEQPLGPYRDLVALTDPASVPFAIDPHPFRDADGRWYLFHARDFLDRADERGRAARVGTALVVHELETMTRLAEHGHTVARARHDWQRYARDRPMYGGSYDWHTLEGPCVIAHAGRYWCLYSGGCWQDASYGVDYVVADAIAGPWSDAGAEQGPRVLRTVRGHVLGPGHCSVVAGPDPAQRWLAYHAWGPDGGARRLCIDPLTIDARGPRCDGPSWTPQPLPSSAPRAASAG